MNSFQGFLEIRGRRLYAEYRKPENGFPLLVLMNGLSQTADEWTPFIEHLSSDDFGYLRFDFRGQGRSLRWELENRGEFNAVVSVDEQILDMQAILDQLGITSPLNLVAHSYGGGVALRFAAEWPDRVANLILTVPYLIRLDRAFPVQRALASQAEMMRGFGFFPHLTLHSAEKWYQQFLGHYMDYRYQNAVRDPVVRRALIHLTFGIMNFDAFKILDRLPSHSLHLMTVGLDTLVPRSLYSELWAKLPARVKESCLFIEDGEHLILDQAPGFCARWTEVLLSQDPPIDRGRRFTGRAYSFEVWDDLTGQRLSLQDKIRPTMAQKIV
jgi:pimeloyl-ACP methyl ester carboxylesterase